VNETAGPSGEHNAPRAAEVREQARRLRSLPVDQVITDHLLSLLNAAQAKLGRRDARLLIDVTTVAHQHARPYLADQLATQIDQILGQLRLGQVNAEGHPNRESEPEENDLARAPSPPAAGTA
jgi:hypothetical protein